MPSAMPGGGVGVAKGKSAIDGGIVESETQRASMAARALGPEGLVGSPSRPPTQPEQPFDPREAVWGAFEWSEADGVDASVPVSGHVRLSPAFVWWHMGEALNEHRKGGLGVHTFLAWE
jgi:hypothetical protein